MQVNSSWVEKSRALDAYRWLLLREKYSFLGSVVRFAKDAISDLLFGCRACFRYALDIPEDSCDYLLLQSAPKVINFQRKRLLMESLRAAGHDLRELALLRPQEILQGRLLKRPPQKVPLRYLGYAAYSEWLVERYQPQILLNDRNGSLYSPFLRLSLNRRNCYLVHLAHATTVESSQRLSMNDYDYYFLFGSSSLEALEARKIRFGSSTVVLSGSHMVDRQYDMPVADLSLRTVLILGVGPDKEKEKNYLQVYGMLREWAARNSRFKVLVKSHPRSNAPFWLEASKDISNIHVLPSDCTLAAALERSCIVINIMSNAVIEAALARRALIFVAPSDVEDIFQQERFLGARISDVCALDKRLEEICESFTEALSRSEAFTSFHLAHGVDGLQNSVDALRVLLQSKTLSGDAVLASSIKI